MRIFAKCSIFGLGVELFSPCTQKIMNLVKLESGASFFDFLRPPEKPAINVIEDIWGSSQYLGRAVPLYSMLDKYTCAGLCQKHQKNNS
jgi:hypothetical protein